MICLLLVLPISLFGGYKFKPFFKLVRASLFLIHLYSRLLNGDENVDYLGYFRLSNSTLKKYKEKGESNGVITVFIYSKHYSSAQCEVFLRYFTFFFCPKTSISGIYFTHIIELILH